MRAWSLASPTDRSWALSASSRSAESAAARMALSARSISNVSMPISPLQRVPSASNAMMASSGASPPRRITISSLETTRSGVSAAVDMVHPATTRRCVVSGKRMRPVIIGAGRGSRLEHLTEEIPKTLVTVMDRPILDWVLDALAMGGFPRKDVIFICGYRAEVIKERYPEFTYVHNHDWENNNILLSLMCAREHLTGGFVSTYAD